ncbi:MAG: IS66 family insertion sequence element accessory protein TnpB [Burkholderiaceae bacterium]|nr:IS66 family insertion sequence element accessory protein TnpB [Burkholderiaceae bacterium]
MFANRSSTRIKVLVHDGLGIWLASRRLHRGRFVWADTQAGTRVPLSQQQL